MEPQICLENVDSDIDTDSVEEDVLDQEPDKVSWTEGGAGGDWLRGALGVDSDEKVEEGGQGRPDSDPDQDVPGLAHCHPLLVLHIPVELQIIVNQAHAPAANCRQPVRKSKNQISRYLPRKM